MKFTSTVLTFFGLLCPIHACTPVDFTIIFDEYPSEVGYELVCDQETIWDVQRGSFPPNVYQFETYNEEACIESAQSCILTVLDSETFSDGLVSPTEGRPGMFALDVDSATVFAYDGAEGNAEYTELSSSAFCIGTGCDLVSTDNDNCVDVQLELIFDEFPSEVGYLLRCESDLIWNVPRGSFLPSQGGFQVTNDDACVPASACCDFTVFDSVVFQDGMISPQEGIPGQFEVTYGNRIVASYNGETDGGYEALSFEFGRGC